MTGPGSPAENVQGTVCFRRERARRFLQSLAPRPAALALATRLLTAILICGVTGGAKLEAQTPKPTDFEVEAAYLSNFGRFVEWPATSASAASVQFNVCVLGTDPFGPLLDNALKGETIRGVPMMAKRIAGPEESGSCRVLYIGSSTDGRLKAALAALRTSTVLTVSDAADFTRLGGMIQFVLEGNKVRFEINLAAAHRSSLSVSSELLKVATAIRKGP